METGTDPERVADEVSKPDQDVSDRSEVESNASHELPSSSATLDMSMKHPLQHKWKLWYDHPGKKTSQQSWGEHLRLIYAFDTVEDFWRLWNNIMPCSKLAPGSNYSLFKDGIEPKWEDPVNKYGGKWVVQFPSKQRDKLHQYWLYIVLALIGETFQADDDVCGVVVSIRKADKIAVWTKDSDETSTMLIGQRFKQCLELPENTVVSYQSHNTAMKRNSSFNNPSKYDC